MSSLYTPFSREGGDSREILQVNTFDVKTIKKHKQTNASCIIYLYYVRINNSQLLLLLITQPISAHSCYQT